MHSLLILIDGLGDDPISAWQGQMPFDHAVHPAMDALAAHGAVGSFSICENELIPESSSCILRLLGVHKNDIPRNRAYLELLAQQRDITEYEVVLRCNLAVMDDDGKLAAFNGQGLSADEMDAAARACNAIRKDIEFIHLSEYRNLLIMDKHTALLDVNVPPPHESVGEMVSDLLTPLLNSSLALKYFWQQARERLRQFDKPGLHYILYPWGVSARQAMPTFQALHGLRGGAVCKAEIVAGMAKALGMEVFVPATATGDVDTDIPAKAEATLGLLAHNDFVIAHFNGTDEAGHRYDYKSKADMIARIDREFLQPVMAQYSEPLKVVICGDHVTSSVTGKHGDGPTPVVAGYLPIDDDKHTIQLQNYKDIINFLMKASD